MVLMLIATCIMSFAGITGYTAVNKESARSLAGYFFLTSLLALFFLWSSAYGLTLETSLAPVLQRQVGEFCNGSTHHLYQHVLGCNYSAGYLRRKEAIRSVRGECGLTCLDRVAQLQRMGGCQFLEDLCENFVYTKVGTGRCLVESAQGQHVTAPTMVSRGVPHNVVYLNASQNAARVVKHPQDSNVNISTGTSASQHCCKWACNMAPQCAGYAFDFEESVCYMVSPQPPPDSEMNPLSICSSYHWTRVEDKVLPGLDLAHLSVVAGDGHLGTECYRKEFHLVMMEAIASNGLWLAVGSLVACSTLLGATVCACLLQYTMTTQRQGRKGGVALLGKMLCPCLQPRPRAGRISLDDGSSSSSDSELPGRSGGPRGRLGRTR